MRESALGLRSLRIESAAPHFRRAALNLGLIVLSCAAAAPPAIGTATAATLSPEAQLGRQIFFDPSLSASGKLSCASCHDPTNAYAAPKASGAVIRGGANMDRPGLRAVPSLRYLSDTPRFSRHTYMDMGRDREDVGPAGGFMLDGRADNLREQMLLPLLDPAELANSNVADVAARLRRAPYAAQLAGPQPLVDAAAAALERFELEDPSFHPYNSRFDQHLRGTAVLSAEELEGLRLFVDPAKGNCAACHTATTGPGGRAPTFTDYSFHALGVPRNPAIPANADPRFFDLGLCGPRRTDLQKESQYCGYFKTPTLRNVARRQFFFHNSRFANLQDVMHFYVERDTDARRWYPTLAGKLQKFDDVPTRYRGNVNISDAPLNRSRDDQPALDVAEIGKVIVFLATLNDIE